MSESNPIGAVQALAGRTFAFGSRELCLTNGVLCACDIVENEIENEELRTNLFLAAFLVFGDRQFSGKKVERWLMRGCLAMSDFLIKEMNASLKRADDALTLAGLLRDAVDHDNSSHCEYDPPKGMTNSQVISGVGNRIKMAALAMRIFGMSFDQFLFAPASRINALYASECEYAGMNGLNTFYGREILERFDSAFKKNKTEPGSANETV